MMTIRGKQISIPIFNVILENFDMVHFHGEEVMCLFHENNQNLERCNPWEFLELSAKGSRLGALLVGV